MKNNCTTNHHQACPCREEKFLAIEQERDKLVKENQDLKFTMGVVMKLIEECKSDLQTLKSDLSYAKARLIELGDF